MGTWRLLPASLRTQQRAPGSTASLGPATSASCGAAASTSTSYGAAITTRQFVLIVVALAAGTIIEWLDFFVYSMLHSVLVQVFFPAQNPATQSLTFWGIFFAGFIARPFGSVVFGHIGDTRGRRLALLLSICLMGVPTVLIGCLPTYAHIGIAAPILLALLRLVQGVAMGGEFGSALVYLHEIAAQKGFAGSIGFASAISGCMLGVLEVLILESALTPQQMLVFGWRIPFLVSVFSAAIALALRLHMPEPDSFLRDRQVLQQNDLRVITDYTGRSAIWHPGSALSSTKDASVAAGSTRSGKDGGAGSGSGSGQGGLLAASQAASAAAADADMCLEVNTPQEQQQQDGAGKGGTPGRGRSSTGGGGWRQLPFIMLMRWHWAAVLLQLFFEAYVSCNFYTLTTWLPHQMSLSLGVPVPVQRGMVLVNLFVCVVMMLLAGAASDRGLPRLVSANSVFVVAGAITAPVLLYGMRPNALASVWLLHALLLALVGWVLGVIPAACSVIYPPAVRTTGFNLGHNASMSWLGGLSPTIVTALAPIAAAAGNKFLAPSVLLVAAAGASLAAGVMLMWYAPAANKRPAAAADGAGAVVELRGQA